MNQIKQRFANVNTFEETARLMMNKEIITLSKDLILNYNLERKVNFKQLLSCFIITKFPAESIGPKDIETYTELIKAGVYLVESERSNFEHRLLNYVNHFDIWKNKDYTRLVDEMFNRYHKLTVDILNAPEESKMHLNNCKVEILSQAKKMGGRELVTRILSYKPVVIDTEKLQESYTNIYWDVFTEKYNNKDYTMLYELLNYIRDLYCTLAPSRVDSIKEIIDVQFIKDRIEHDAYNLEELKSLTDALFDIIKSLHAPYRDSELQDYLKTLNAENLYFPHILKKVIYFSELIVIDIKNLKKD